MDIYPILFHAYVGSIAVCKTIKYIGLAFIANKYMKTQTTVREIYLLEGGKATQIVFENQLKRKLFGEILSSTYYNSMFVTPE
jgi:hypothetical protein